MRVIYVNVVNLLKVQLVNVVNFFRVHRVRAQSQTTGDIGGVNSSQGDQDNGGVPPAAELGGTLSHINTALRELWSERQTPDTPSTG